MRAQTVLSALASIALLGAAALLAVTTPSRAMQIHASPSPVYDTASGRARGGCGLAVLSHPNVELQSGYARPTVTTRVASRCASDLASVWGS